MTMYNFKKYINNKNSNDKLIKCSINIKKKLVAHVYADGKFFSCILAARGCFVARCKEGSVPHPGAS